MADRQKNTSACVDITVSDFDCLSEKINGKRSAGKFEKKKCACRVF